jgi:hypothetical protein
MGAGDDKRFELSEPAGRVFKVPGASLGWIKKVLDNVKRDLGNTPPGFDIFQNRLFSS